MWYNYKTWGQKKRKLIGKCSSLCDNHYEEFNMKEDGKNIMTREPALIRSFSTYLLSSKQDLQALL